MRLVVFILASGFASFGLAEVRLAKIFTDQMVLQQGQPAMLWGWAAPGESVKVSLAMQTAVTKADQEGRWQVSIDVPPAGGPYDFAASGAKNRIELRGVMVGEVWICSGQSNMQWSVRDSADPEVEVSKAFAPQLRFFTVQMQVADTPQTDLPGRVQGVWEICSPDSVTGFSAVAYTFGRQLAEELKVPVGLIHTSWGGTPAEAWTSRQALETHPRLARLVQAWDRRVAAFDRVVADAAYRESLAAWQKLADAAKAMNQPPPDGKPAPPESPAAAPHRPANLFNAMIAPLIPLRIRGAIWYQGESNVGRADQYHVLFPTMIGDWRGRFGQGDFPFLFVQLAPYIYSPQGSPLPELWDAQLHTLRTVPGTGMAVTTDIADLNDIHPKNKQDVGKRLARWALHHHYGRADLVPSGPLYRAATAEGNRMRISFDYAEQGLKTRDRKPLADFTIASADGPFVPAQAEIDGSSVVVWSPEVSHPAAVRFAWQQDAQPNLVNTAGLPASPFRTDTRALTTLGIDDP